MFRCGSKNKHEKDTCLEVIRLLAKNMLTLVSSIVKIIVGRNLYNHLMSTRVFTAGNE